MGQQVPTNKTTSRSRRARKHAQKPSAENECVRHWISFACERCACPELANNIPYTFNVHLKRYAGVAHLIFCGVIFVDSKIVLARRLWPKLNEAGRRNLVVHEACHVIQAHLFGPHTEDHGAHWKWCMRRCDAPPNLCVQEHELHKEFRPSENYQPPGLVLARCGCTGHRKIPIGQARLIRTGERFCCEVCRRPISLVYA